MQYGVEMSAGNREITGTFGYYALGVLLYRRRLKHRFSQVHITKPLQSLMRVSNACAKERDCLSRRLRNERSKVPVGKCLFTTALLPQGVAIVRPSTFVAEWRTSSFLKAEAHAIRQRPAFSCRFLQG